VLVYDYYDDGSGVLHGFELIFEGFWVVLGVPVITSVLWVAFSTATSNGILLLSNYCVTR
jgi:hypothetical protein